MPSLIVLAVLIVAAGLMAAPFGKKEMLYLWNGSEFRTEMKSTGRAARLRGNAGRLVVPPSGGSGRLKAERPTTPAGADRLAEARPPPQRAVGVQAFSLSTDSLKAELQRR